MHSMPNFAVLEGESRHESSAKQQQAAMFVSDILEKRTLSTRSAHQSPLYQSPYLYLFFTTKVFPKFLLPFQSQASFQSEEFGPDDYAPRSLSPVECSLSGLGAHAHAKKTPVGFSMVSLQNFMSLIVSAIAFGPSFPLNLRIDPTGTTLSWESKVSTVKPC